MIVALFLAILLGTLRIEFAHAIIVSLRPPYGEIALHVIGVLFIVSVALLIDRVIRFAYWDRWLRRRRNQNTPKLVEDIVTIVLLIVGLAAGLSYEAGLSTFTGILTASGATAVVLGIALQAVIQDLFSGLSVNFDGSYAIGDWVTVKPADVPEPFYGRVTGITWRATYLTTEEGVRVMMPNHLMTTLPVINHTRPGGPKRLEVEVEVEIRVPSNRVIDMLLGEAFKAVRQSGLARNPEPEVLISKLSADAVFYRVQFYYQPDLLCPDHARSLVLKALHDVIWLNELPLPVTQIEMTEPPNLAFTLGEQEMRDALKEADLFENVLNAEQFELLAQHSKTLELPRGYVLMRQGDPPSSMFIIMEGAASVSVSGKDNEVNEVAISATGDIAGEMSLMTGTHRNATVSALSRMRVLEIRKEAIEALLRDTPELLDRFGKILAKRQHELDELANRPSRREAVETDILSRMKKFFADVLSA
ncbi:MAG TPA: mechanosensitive ion channel family protein [Rhizomicrobium sp.]|nr:mechanosensitive ion channel family protein [Rhizomicrobium sp.]